MPVSQSSELWKSLKKVRWTVMLSRGIGVAGCRCGTSLLLALGRWSVTWSEFDQLNPPSRIGVSKLSAVMRELASVATVSKSPPGSASSTVSLPGLLVVLFVKLSPGDHEMSEPSAIGTGERVTAGSSCWTLPSGDSGAGCRPASGCPMEAASNS